jgi:hypothetical protein
LLLAKLPRFFAAMRRCLTNVSSHFASYASAELAKSE